MYPIANISPHSFEHLVADLLECETGERFERFGPGPDNGVDARSVRGTILQAKRYVNSTFAQLESACKTEGERYLTTRPPNGYYLATSLVLTVGKKEKLVRALGNANCISANILGFDDIQSLLRKHESIARSHIGLWVSETGILDAVINSEENGRRRVVLQGIERSLKNYTPYPKINLMLSQLEKEGTLIVKGPPGVGKTLLSHAIITHYLQGGWELRVLGRFGEAYKPAQNNKKILLWFDDCLGTSQLSDTTLSQAASDLPNLVDSYRNDPSKLLLLTTRDYMVNRATRRSDRLSRDQILCCHFEVYPEDFSTDYKANILSKYVEASGFIKYSADVAAYRNQYRQIYEHANFNPRLIADTISALSSRVTSLEELLEEVQRGMDEPEKAYETIFYVHLGPADRLTLLSVCLASAFGMGRVSPDEAWTAFVRENDKLGFSLKGDGMRWNFDASLAALNGSFLRLDSHAIALANPGIFDFIYSILRKNGNLSSVWEYVSKYSDLVRVTSLLKLPILDVLQSQEDVFKRVTNRIKLSLLNPRELDDEFDELSDEGGAISDVADIVHDIVRGPSSDKNNSWPVDILELALVMYTTNTAVVRQEAYHLDEVIIWMEHQIDHETVYASLLIRHNARISTFIQGCTEDWLGNDLYCSRPDDPEMSEVIGSYVVILGSRFVTQKTRGNLQHHAKDALVGAEDSITKLRREEVKDFQAEARLLARLFGVDISKFEQKLAFHFPLETEMEHVTVYFQNIHPDQLCFKDYEEWPLMIRGEFM